MNLIITETGKDFLINLQSEEKREKRMKELANREKILIQEEEQMELFQNKRKSRFHLSTTSFKKEETAAKRRLLTMQHNRKKSSQKYNSVQRALRKFHDKKMYTKYAKNEYLKKRAAELRKNPPLKFRMVLKEMEEEQDKENFRKLLNRRNLLPKPNSRFSSKRSNERFGAELQAGMNYKIVKVPSEVPRRLTNRKSSNSNIFRKDSKSEQNFYLRTDSSFRKTGKSVDRKTNTLKSWNKRTNRLDQTGSVEFDLLTSQRKTISSRKAKKRFKKSRTQIEVKDTFLKSGGFRNMKDRKIRSNGFEFSQSARLTKRDLEISRKNKSFAFEKSQNKGKPNKFIRENLLETTVENYLVKLVKLHGQREDRSRRLKERIMKRRNCIRKSKSNWMSEFDSEQMREISKKIKSIYDEKKYRNEEMLNHKIDRNGFLWSKFKHLKDYNTREMERKLDLFRIRNSSI
jgi:hypothetical protein